MKKAVKKTVSKSAKKQTERKKAAPASTGKPEGGVKKQYLKENACKVTFKLPKEAALDARMVTVVGDFNEWNAEATPLKKQRDGSFSQTVTLACGKEYRFRYLIDGSRWENDWQADKYVPNVFASEDSVVVVK